MCKSDLNTLSVSILMTSEDMIRHSYISAQATRRARMRPTLTPPFRFSGLYLVQLSPRTTLEEPPIGRYHFITKERYVRFLSLRFARWKPICRCPSNPPTLPTH